MTKGTCKSFRVLRSFAVVFAGVSMVASFPGCRSWTGLDAGTKFACHAPDGVLCESMSGIYANAIAKKLAAQTIRGKGSSGESFALRSTPATSGKLDSVMTAPLQTERPLRSAPRVLRVWFAPWEDSEGDLHDQSHLYLVIDRGKWLVDHFRRDIARPYRPLLSDGGFVGRKGPVINQTPPTQGDVRDADISFLPSTFESMAPETGGEPL